MAINNGNTDTSENTSTGYAGQSNAQSGGDFDSFHSGNTFASPVSADVGNEVYTKLKERLVEVFKATTTEYTVTLLDLDKISEPSLRYSSLIVALSQRGKEDLGVAYHILMLAGTNTEDLPTFTTTIGSQQVEILRVPSDAIDKELRSRAAEKVRKAFPNVDSIYVEATVVPAGFNPEDKSAVQKLARNAGMACATELRIQSKSFRDLNLARLKKDSTLNITQKFGRMQYDNLVGEPFRSDVRVEFVSKENGTNNQNASLNSGNKEVSVSTVSGFIDMIYAPMQQQQSNGYSMVPLVATQRYAPRLVLTDVTSNFAFTPSAILLAIVSAMTVGENNNWMQAYRPTDTPAGVIDMNDIGALNIEANPLNDPSGYGPMFETKANKITLPQLGAYMMTLIRPGMTLSMDCPEGGPQAWYLSVFAAAARNKKAAYDVIVQAANELFDGAFGRHFPAGAPIFAEVSRVHLGYWMDRNGTKRDIRDFDHVAVSNLQGQSNPLMIRDFADTYLRTEFPLPQRLAARARYLRSLSNETAVFTGYAERVTFSSVFLNALQQSVKETQLPVKVNTPLSSSDFNDARGVGNFVNSAMMSPEVVFQQPAAYGMANNQYGYFNGGGRW